jgi:iron complex transport system ATP-binding protein
LLSTHDLAFALAYADDAALVKEGKVLACGKAADTLTVALLTELYGHPFRTMPVPVPFFA